MAQPKIVVVGAGAIGCYYGARLAESGEDVRFLMRSDLVAVQARGLVVELPDRSIQLPRVAAYGDPQSIGPVDMVVIGLKTTANAEFERLIRPLLHERTVLVTLQNGLGSDEKLAAMFGGQRVIGGLCFICVNRLAPGKIRCIQPGTISLGEFGRPAGAQVRDFADRLSKAGIKVQVGDNLAELRWKKLVWNVPFNGLSIAAGGITTDRILANPELERLVRDLMGEVIAAASRLGFVIPATLIEKQIEITRPMGAYRPSSLIDYLEGREVEVESIWGEPVRRARAVGAAVPKMEMLYALLTQLARPGKGPA